MINLICYLLGSRKVKQRTCQECAQYFEAERLLAPIVDDTTTNDDEWWITENNVNIAETSLPSPKRTPLRDISQDVNINSKTPATSTRTRSEKVGIMSQLKSALKMQSAAKPILENKNEQETLDLNSWTHSHTPPMNSPFVLSPNMVPEMTPKTVVSQQPLSTIEKINRIATPESMIGSPITFSPENTNVYTDVVEVRPSLHIDTFRIMLISLLIVILSTTSMIIPQSSFKNIRSSSKDSSNIGHYIINQASDIEIKYDIPAYTGDFSLSDPVHNRNQVSLFASNIHKVFHAFLEKIIDIRSNIMNSIIQIKDKIAETLDNEMRMFTKVF